MSGRLFAYGGLKYGARGTGIGKWNLTQQSAFDQSAGIPAGGFAVGLLWDAEGAALLLRQIQEDHERRKNPFTLLLDPGTGIWERFAWNPGALAVSVIAAGTASTGPGEGLFAKPETWDSARLDSFIAGLAPSHRTPEPNEAFAALWCGAMLEGDIVAAPFTAAALPEGDFVRDLAAKLEAIAPCFRAAASWIAGANRSLARDLGVRLVLNNFEAGLLPEGLIERGARVSHAWQAASMITGAFDAYSRTPLPRWTETPPIVIERAEALLAFHQGAPHTASLLADIAGALGEGEPAGREIRLAAIQYLLKSGPRLSADKSTLLLALLAKTGEPLTPAIVAQLDAAKLEDYLDRNPSAPLPPALPVDVRLRIWKRRLVAAASQADAESLATQALADLPEPPRPEIVRHAVSACRGAPSLSSWHTFFSKSGGDLALRANDAAIFSAESIRRLREGTATGLDDYLTFAPAGGGAELVDLRLSTAEYSEIFAGIVARAQAGKDPRAGRAKRWLAEAARSPLRPLIPIARKLELYSLGLREWASLCRLHDLYCGRVETAAGAAADPDDRQYLKNEFVELLTLPQPLTGGVPRLSEIRRFLKELPASAAPALEKIVRALPEESLLLWAKELHAAGLSALADTVFARCALRGSGEEAEEAELAKLDPDALAKQLRSLLADASAENRAIQARLTGLLQRTGKNTDLRRTIGAAVTGVLDSLETADEKDAALVWERLLRTPEILYLGIAAMSPDRQSAAIAQLEQIQSQQIRAEALKAAGLLRRGEPIESEWTRSLLTYLYSEPGARLRAMVGEDAYEGTGGAKAFDAHLATALQMPTRPQAPASQWNLMALLARIRQRFNSQAPLL